MTNKLLATVMAFAVSTGLAAHAAQDPQRALPQVNLAKITLPKATSVPQAVQTVQTAANHVADVATTAVDPSAAIRAAFQRDHVALEHLRQPASALKGSAHPAFNHLISNDEATLVELEKTALAVKSGSAASSIAAMDQLVASAQAELNRQLATAGATKATGNGHAKKS
ncbi:MAG: hypothetical protein ABI401_10660 [Candidatus Dormibacter sp.]